MDQQLSDELHNNKLYTFHTVQSFYTGCSIWIGLILNSFCCGFRFGVRHVSTYKNEGKQSKHA